MSERKPRRLDSRIRCVLVANRGEIAVRIIRACRELGIETVQVYSEADRDTLAVRLADRSVCIGQPRATDSYLDPLRILSAAVTFGADAIHPGYGFLSEKAAFARMCEDAGITFIGPSPQVIDSMGDKAEARKLAKAAGVPVTPGSGDVVTSIEDARAIAAGIGYPVLLKASAGGGGRGMRVVIAAEDIAEAYGQATSEAQAAFGDGALYVEKFLPRVRHVEIQVLGDGEHVVHLGERECSTQRRNQKLVEEAPSPGIDDRCRAAMAEAAVRLCRQVGYASAGTVEFIVDMATGQYYFIEMNTRIQVEHPVTEMVTGIDLVKAQIEIAGGRPLGLTQAQVRTAGHSIECRINAESVAQDFAPCPGLVTRCRWPGGPGVRVDAHIHQGDEVPPYYDSLLAKIVVWGATRDEAIARMRRALDETVVEGIDTTIGFHRTLLDDPVFRDGDVHTRYVEEVLLRR